MANFFRYLNGKYFSLFRTVLFLLLDSFVTNIKKNQTNQFLCCFSLGKKHGPTLPMILHVLSGTAQVLPYLQTKGSHAFNEAKRGISKRNKPPHSALHRLPLRKSKPYKEQKIQIYLVSIELSEAKPPSKSRENFLSQ